MKCPWCTGEIERVKEDDKDGVTINYCKKCDQFIKVSTCKKICEFKDRDNMKSVINWIDIRDRRPKDDDFGWFLVVLKPVNFEDFENEKDLNGWIEKYGLDKVWFNNKRFWDTRKDMNTDISERVIYWAEIPSVPLL